MSKALTDRITGYLANNDSLTGVQISDLFRDCRRALALPAEPPKMGPQTVRGYDGTIIELHTTTGNAERKEYRHWPWCNGSIYVPAGEPGHSCCCFNAKTESVIAALAEASHARKAGLC